MVLILCSVLKQTYSFPAYSAHPLFTMSQQLLDLLAAQLTPQDLTASECSISVTHVLPLSIPLPSIPLLFWMAHSCHRCQLVGCTGPCTLAPSTGSPFSYWLWCCTAPIHVGWVGYCSYSSYSMLPHPSHQERTWYFWRKTRHVHYMYVKIKPWVIPTYVKVETLSNAHHIPWPPFVYHGTM